MTVVDDAVEPAEPATGAPSRTETTRLMCAAAYLESTFAQEVIEEVVDEPFRAVRLPEGVDIVPVVKHCLAARRQKAIRDTVLLGVLVVATLLALTTSKLVTFVVVGFLLGWIAVAADLWASSFNVATKKLSATQFRPEEAPDTADATAMSRLADLSRRQRGNLVVYSGFNPFSSAGFDLDGGPRRNAGGARRGRGRRRRRVTASHAGQGQALQAPGDAQRRVGERERGGRGGVGAAVGHPAGGVTPGCGAGATLGATLTVGR